MLHYEGYQGEVRLAVRDHKLERFSAQRAVVNVPSCSGSRAKSTRFAAT